MAILQRSSALWPLLRESGDVGTLYLIADSLVMFSFLLFSLYITWERPKIYGEFRKRERYRDNKIREKERDSRRYQHDPYESKQRSIRALFVARFHDAKNVRTLLGVGSASLTNGVAALLRIRAPGPDKRPARKSKPLKDTNLTDWSSRTICCNFYGK